MTATRATAPWYAPAPSGRCLYHCKSATRPRPLSSGGRRIGWVYACPAQTVSTVMFIGPFRRPSPTATRRYLQARLFAPERARLRDLRAATRHGAELGPIAERALGTPSAANSIRLLYWRRYPRKVGRRYSFLYACFRHGVGEVRFFAATSANPPCPWCAAAPARRRATPAGRKSRKPA